MTHRLSLRSAGMTLSVTGLLALHGVEVPDEQTIGELLSSEINLGEAAAKKAQTTFELTPDQAAIIESDEVKETPSLGKLSARHRAKRLAASPTIHQASA